MQTTGRLFDDLARIMTTAAGAAQGAAREVETLMRAQFERLMGELDLIPREEFEAVKAVAQAARAEADALAKRVTALEARLTAPEGKTGPAATRRVVNRGAAAKRRSSAKRRAPRKTP